MCSLISIVVPIYKVEKYLHKCVDSIINQTYKNLEIILVDDGSPDDCGKICDEYAGQDSRVKVIHKENGGLSDARNAGIDVAQGDYIAFVDSDDYIASDMMETLYNCIKRDNSDLALCSFTYVDEEGHQIEKQNKVSPIKNETISKNEAFLRLCNYANWYYVVGWNKLYKKELFKEIRFPKGKVREDEFLVHHIFNECSIISCVEKACYYYLQRTGSIMSETIATKSLDFIEALQDRLNFAINHGLNNLAYCSFYMMIKEVKKLNLCNKASQQVKEKAYNLYLQSSKKIKMKNLPLKRKTMLFFAKMLPGFLVRK